jgi:hypothetical protein
VRFKFLATPNTFHDRNLIAKTREGPDLSRIRKLEIDIDGYGVRTFIRPKQPSLLSASLIDASEAIRVFSLLEVIESLTR